MLTGCASGHHTGGAPHGVVPKNAAAGARIFKTSCATCHTLTRHDTNIEGGDLGLLPGTVAEVESFARIMPVRPPLTSTDAKTVAVYIVGVERRTVRQRR